jgi:hypothetical protein
MFGFGVTPLLDEEWDEVATPLDVVKYLATHDTIGGSSLGVVSDTVPFAHPYLPMLVESIRLGEWWNEPWRVGKYDPYYDDRKKNRWSTPTVVLVREWSTPSIELARNLEYAGDDWNGRPRIWARRWDTPYLVEDRSFVATRVIRWVSRTTGEVVHTLATDRALDSSWVATHEWTHYEHYGAGLARVVLPPVLL